MAGNRVQYIIDLVVQDKQLRQQMAKIDWEGLIGSKGKGVADAFTKGTVDAANQLKNTFSGLNIDWNQILGAKDLGRLEQQMAKVLTRSKNQIKGFAAMDDTSGIQRTVEYVTALGNELKGLGSSFDAAQLTKGMTSFMRVLGPLSGKIGELANEPAKVEAAFDRLFNSASSGMNNMAKSSAKMTSLMSKVEASTKSTGGTEATLNKLVKRFGELQNFKAPDWSSFSLDKLETEIDRLEERWDSLEAKFAGKKQTSAYQLERGKFLLEQKGLYEAYDNAYKKSNNKSYFGSDVVSDIESELKRINTLFEEAIAKFQQQLSSDSFAQKLAKQLDNIQIKLSLEDNAEQALKDKINTLVNELNGKTTPAKIQIDYSLKNTDIKNNVAKNIDVDKLKEALQSEVDFVDKKIAELQAQKEHYDTVFTANPKNKTAKHHSSTIAKQIEELTKQQEANKYSLANITDESVQRALTSTLNDFKAINKVVSSQQSSILAETLAWRQKMMDAMQFSKGDIDFSFGIGKTDAAAESLLDELNAFFADNAIDITINKEKLKKDIAEVFGQGGVSFGGGSATIDPKTLVSAIATGLQAALTGDFTPVTDKNDNKNTPPKTPVVPVKKATYLDPQDPYNAYMGKAFIEIAKYAQGTGKPAKELKNFFDNKMYGATSGQDPKTGKNIPITLETIANSESLMESLVGLAQVIDNGGNTLNYAFQELVRDIGNNKAISTFGTDLSELLYTLNVSQKTLSEDEISRQSISVFKDFATRQQLVSGISNILKLDTNSLASLKSEDVGNLSSIASRASEEAVKSGDATAGQYYQKIVGMLDTLKSARESAGNVDDEAKQQQLSNAVNNFSKDIEQTYNDLLNYVLSFRMHAYVKGKNPIPVAGGKSGRSLSRVLNTLGGDWSKLEDVTIQKYPSTAPIGVMSKREEQRLMRNSGKDTLYRPGPDRTDILNKDTSIRDFVLSDNTPKKWQDTTEASVKASKRATTATEMLEDAEKRATSLANTEAELESQIEAKRQQKASTENEIATNQKKISKLIGDDSRKISGAQTRLRNSETRVEQTSQTLALARNELEEARKEKEEADKLYAEIQKNAARGDYNKFDDADAQVARYEAWAKNPIKYRKDMIGEVETYTDKKGVVHQRLIGGIYEDDYRTATHYRDLAKAKADKTEELLANASHKTSNLQKKIKKFGETPELKRALDLAIADEQTLRNKLETFRKEVDENQAILNDIYRKRKGTTKQDKADFAADAKRKLNGYYAEDGSFVPGKIQYATQYKNSLGIDPRDGAASRMEQANAMFDTAQTQAEKAQEAYDAALKKQNEVAKSDDYVKRAIKVNELNKKNEILSHEVSDLDASIKKDVETKAQNASKMQANTSESRLSATENLKASIDTLINEQGVLEQEILKSKAEAESIDEFVAQKMKQRGHKTPNYDIKHSKKETKTIDSYSNYINRGNYLDLVASDNMKEGYFVPKNLTSNIKKAIESLASSREVIKLLGEDTNEAIAKLGLDKFSSESDVQAEVKARLDRNTKGKTKIAPVIAEFYNKILTDGQNGAMQWLKTQMSSAQQNIETQTQKLKTLSQSDFNKATELKPVVDELDKGLKQTYKDRVDTWIVSLQQKIADLEAGGLSDKDSLLAIKEIEGLFELINKATSDYNKRYIKQYDDAIKKEKGKLPQLNRALQAAIQKKDDYKKIELEDEIKEIENRIKAYENSKEKLRLLKPEQAQFMSNSSKYSYSRKLNENTDRYERELAGNISKTQSAISERSGALEFRRAELLREMQGGASSEKLEKELKDINIELAKYQQYIKMLDAHILFVDDVEFANEYKNKLAEIIALEQQADLARSTGASSSDLEAKYAEINAKQTALDQSAYDKLKSKQQSLLADIGAFAKEGKSTSALEQSLASVNTLLSEYELHNRRVADSSVDKEMSLFGASEYVIDVYNEKIKETIRLEQELALVRAKSQDVTNDQAVKDASAALNTHNRSVKKAIQRAIDDQIEAETRGSSKVQALGYLRETEQAYHDAYSKRYTLKSRIKRTKGQLEDVAPDNNYQNTYLYKSHLRAKKQEMTNEYVHSGQLKADREAGKAKVEAEMAAYLEQMIGPEAAQRVLYELTRNKDNANLNGLKDTFGNMLVNGFEDSKGVFNKARQAAEKEYKDSEAYKNLVSSRQSSDQKELDRVMFDRRSELQASFDAIDNKTQAAIQLIQTVTEKDYMPLKEEMSKVSSRVNLAKMQDEFQQALKGFSPKKSGGRVGMKTLLGGIARRNGANNDEIKQIVNALDSIGDNKIKNVRDWAPNVFSSVFDTTDEGFLKQARANLIAQEQARAAAEKATLQKEYNKEEAKAKASLSVDTRKVLDRHIDEYVEKYIRTRIESAFSDEVFASQVGDKATDITSHFNNLMKEHVYSLVEKYAEGLHVGVNMPNSEEIRQEVENRLSETLRILEAQQTPVEADIARIEAQRKAAMKAGGIGYNEIADADILQQQAMFASRLTTEKEKQKAITEEIAQLEKEGGQADKIAELNKAFEASKDISDKMQMLVANRDSLIELQHQIKADEKEEKTLTPEQQRLWMTNALEAAKLNLDSEDPTKKRIAEENVARYTNLLNQLDAKINAQEPEEQGKGGILGMFANLLKDAGGIALDANGLASQATLEQIATDVARILVALGGDATTSVVKDPEMESKLARMRELESKYGGKPSQVTNKNSTTTKDELKVKDLADFTKQVQTLATAIEKEDQGSDKQRSLQEQLIETLRAWAKTDPSKLDNTLTGKKTYLTEKEWEAYLTKHKVLGKIDTDKTPLTSTHLKKLYKDSTDNNTSGVYSKKDYDEYKKLSRETKNYKPEIARSETDGLSSGLAKDETLQKIFDLLNKIANNGLPKSSKASSSATKTVKKTEAELIRDRALVQDEVVRKLSAGKANLYDKYVKDVEDLNNAVKEANKADDKHKARAINKVKNAADRVTALSRNIIRDTAEWEYKSAQGTVVKSFKKKTNVDQAYMENLAQQEAGVNKGQNQYKFLSFDGNVLTYQLTDIEGKVRKVTMEWNAFNKEIAITSDKSVYKLTELAGKVDSLNNKFDEAKNIGFLDEQDKDLQAYYNQLKKIDALIKSGKSSFAEIDKERGKALALGGVVAAKINKNKRDYNGSTLGAVDRQHSKVINTIGTQEDFDESDIGLVQQYKKAYDELHAKYRSVYQDKQKLNKKEQEDLTQQILTVQSLGKQVISQVNEEKHLRELVNNSGEFQNWNGQRVQLGGISGELTTEQKAIGNLKATMLDYAKNELNMANLEHIKFNKTTKQLTGTIRTSSDTVADIVIKYNDATNALYAYNKQERESLTGMRGLIQGFKTKVKSLMQYTMGMTSIYRVFGQLRKGFQYIREVDSALTELKKVTDETEASYDRFLKTASKTAGKIGSTIQEVVSSTADFARLGYTMEEAHTMAESAQVLMNVSEFTDISTATDSLISSIQAFKYTAEESMDVVDILNTIGNNYAISTADLAASLTKSSGSLVAANGTLQEAVALTATANTIIQDADVVGTALKTVAMRLRGTDTTTMEEEGLETDGAIESKSKLQSKILALSGVNILTDTGAYKSTYQILSEIADVWEDINDMDQAALLEILAGKRAGSVMSAILQNPETLKDAFESANEASGSALAENEKYLDSIQGRIDLFTNSIQTMWNNTLDDEFLKTVVNIGTQLVKWVDSLGLIQTLVIGIGTYLTKKYFKGDLFGGLFGQKPQNMTQIKANLEALKQTRDKAQVSLAEHKGSKYKQNKFNKADAAFSAYDKQMSPLIKEYDNLNAKLKTAQSNLDKYQNRLNNYQGTNKKTIAQYQTAVDKAKIEVNNLEAELKEVEMQANKTGNAGVFAGKSFKASFKEAGKAVWKFGKELIASMATMYVISTAMELIAKAGTALVDWVDSKNETPEEAKEKFEELNNELASCQEELENLETEFDTIQEQIAELTAAGKLSFSDQEELERLKAQSDELERQINLNKTLEESLQKSTNEASVNASNKYLDETSFLSDTSRSDKQNKWKENGKTIGQAVGLVAGGLIAAAIITASSGTLTAPAVMIGSAVGGAVGGGVGEVIGSGAAGLSYDSEQSVREAIDNMQEEREKLIEARDEAYKAYLASPSDKKAKEEYDEAAGALSQYDQAMAQHITQLQEYYNSIDYETATAEEKEAMKDMAATIDKYNIQMGSQGAKSSAIERIFGLDEYANASKTIDGLVKQLERDPGNDTILNAIREQAKVAEADLKELGLSIDDVVKHYGDIGESLAFDTVEEKMAEINRASTIFEQLLSPDGYKAATAEMKALGEEYNKLVNGNVDYNKRPLIPTAKMQEVYPEFKDEIATTWDKDEVYGDGKGGVKYTLKFTPILENGKVLDETSYQEYVNNIFAELEKSNGDINKALEYDAANYKLLINWQEGAVEYDDNNFSELDKQLDQIKQKHWELAKSIEPIKVEDLFDIDGKVDQIKLSKIFGSTSNKMRQDITSILEGSYDDIKNGTVKIEDLLTKFALKSTAQFVELQNNIISNQNKEWFPGLKDEISGIIDTFDELAAAVGSVADAMDTLEQARKEEEHSGSVSIETLSKLMEYTDDYSKIVSIDETGAIHLAANAQEVLIQEKIKAIQTNAEAAVNEAELAYQNALAAESSVSFADVIAGSTIPQLDDLAATIAYVGSILGDLEAAMADGFGGVTFSLSDSRAKANNAYNDKISSRQSVRTEATKEAEEALRKAQDNLKIANGLTAKNITTRYSSSKADGSDDEDSDDRLEKLQKKYERQISNLDNQQTYLENEIERLEAENKGVSKSYYEDQIKLEEKKMTLLQQERTELTSLLNSTAEGSDEWWETAEALWEVEHGIQESTLRTIEFRESIADLYKTAFEDLDKAHGDKDDLYSDRQAYIEKYMELLELQGKATPASGYMGLIAEEEAKLANSMAELTNLRQILADGMASGEIKEGDERWIEMQSSIRETEAAILDSKVAIEQYKEELKSLNVEAFNMVREAFSNRNDYYENQQNYIEGYIDYLEATGVDATPEMYEKLIAIEKEKRANNVADLVNARAGLAKLETAGYTAADEEWVDANNRIVELEKSIQDSDIAMAEWEKTIREMEFEKFDQFAERVANLNKELDNVYQLVEDEDVAFDDGTWTKEGITALSMLYHQIENNEKMIDEYNEELAKLEKQYKSGEISEKEYVERAEELKDNQWDLIHTNENLKDTIIDINEARVDLIEEGINEEIDAYRELIDLKKEELNAERDLYEFRRDVEKQTKDISELERKIAALSGSDADSDIAERRKLEAQLREAKDGLNDTYYSHSKDAQSNALDDELDAYQKSAEDYVETLREQLENTEAMIEQTFSDVLLNADVTYQELLIISDTYGPTLSANLVNPWYQMGQEATRIKTQIGEDLLMLNDDNVATFSANAEPLLKTPFEQGGLAAGAFQMTTSAQIDAIQTQVYTASSKMLADLSLPWNSVAGADGPINTFSNTVNTKLTEAVTKAQQDASKMTTSLEEPWKKGSDAVNTWSTNVENALEKTVQDYKKAAAEISKEQAVINNTPSHTTTKTPAPTTTKPPVSSKPPATTGSTQAQQKEAARKAAQDYIDSHGMLEGDRGRWSEDPKFKKLLDNYIALGGKGTDLKGKSNTVKGNISKKSGTINNSSYKVTGLNKMSLGDDDCTITIDGVKYKVYAQDSENNLVNASVQKELNGYFGGQPQSGSLAMYNEKLYVVSKDGGWVGFANKGDIAKVTSAYHKKLNGYAKGTLGTKRDQWAITDEPQFGDELVLVPTAQGNLSYMRKGTSVMPADISANLVEWGKINPDMTALANGVQGVNLMSNYVSKPEVNVSFDSLVHVDNCSQDTLKDLEKMVDTKINQFSKQMNYAIKRYK